VGRREGAVAALTLLLAAFVTAVVPASRAQEPLPDASTFLAATRENLDRSIRLQDRYAYKERRTEVHRNPFGRIGTGGVGVYDVTPTADPQVWIRRLIERDGKPVPDAKPERQQRRPARSRRPSPVEDAAAALRFTVDRREVIDGAPAIVVRFEPRPEAKPQTREGRIAVRLRGSLWVDEASREIVRAEAVTIDSLSFGFGFLARLNPGTTLAFTRERIDETAWLPTSVRIVGQGRAVLFRRLNVDYAIEWFEYRDVAGRLPESRAPRPTPP
jgi:hypothetical protein